MGKEAHVAARFPQGDDESGPEGDDVGRLQYEPPKLIFRGRTRRVFQGAELAGLRAEGGDLVLAGGARFALGEKAAAGWVRAILHPPGRLDKLGVKAGRKAAIAELDDPDFAAELAGRVSPVADGDGLDLLFWGADSAEALARIGAMAARLGDGGALWVVSLKGRLATVGDTEVMAAARAVGLVDSKVCAFSDTRTALRFTRRR